MHGRHSGQHTLLVWPVWASSYRDHTTLSQHLWLLMPQPFLLTPCVARAPPELAGGSGPVVSPAQGTTKQLLTSETHSPGTPEIFLAHDRVPRGLRFICVPPCPVLGEPAEDDILESLFLHRGRWLPAEPGIATTSVILGKPTGDRGSPACRLRMGDGSVTVLEVCCGLDCESPDPYAEVLTRDSRVPLCL